MLRLAFRFGHEKALIKRVDINTKQVIFKLHPSEAPFLKDVIDADPTWTFNDRQVLVLADESVAQGGCILETQAGQMDAQIPTQIDILRRLLGLSNEAY
jgi:flagellar biosynthesis/type III secretory pathway protein FliH